ncbi:hypothetical protein [Photobacterium sanguinicancri]|uniref:hypothetical protein n=1 Tax=Photobacterium sanguinicancri TaxID=875932 RepID=UPI00166FE00B|nr:hypothetical protein [Photobacterium sanguinicancri]
MGDDNKYSKFNVDKALSKYINSKKEEEDKRKLVSELLVEIRKAFGGKNPL